jgi:cytochrome P450
MAGYSMKLQKEKEQHPADDMFTAVGELVTNGTLTQQEFLQWMFVTIAAGFETTHTAIGQSMRMYLEDEQVHERTDRALAEGLSGRVVDEYIRLISPPMHMCRTATRDTVFADTQIRKDDLLVMYYAAANRDTSIFSRPDEFDPWRAEAQTLAFGSGVHRCLGAHLAKLEVSILWEELRAANLNLRLNGEPKRGWSCMINQLTELPVAQV